MVFFKLLVISNRFYGKQQGGKTGIKAAFQKPMIHLLP
jgi:hypothetical protein